MKPKPFSALNHFTVPTVMYLSLPPVSRRYRPRRHRGGADGKGQARPAGCEAKHEPLPGNGSGRGHRALPRRSEARGQANGGRTSTVIGEITYRPVAAVQVGQRILQVGQLQLLDHALDQLAMADRRRSSQPAGRAGAAPTENRTPGRRGHLQALEHASDGWADLAEPLGQGPVAGGQDVDDERAALLRGRKERRGG